MTETQRDVLSEFFSLAIILFAAFITQRFVLPLLWAVILCIATCLDAVDGFQVCCDGQG